MQSVKLRPKHASFWTCTTRLYRTEQVQFILQTHISIHFTHFRFEWKQLKSSITRYSWDKNHSRKCFQKPFMMIQKTWKLWKYRNSRFDIMNDHGLEQMGHFPTREKNTLDLILTTLPGQFQDVHSPDKLKWSWHRLKNLENFHSPRSLGESCIYIRKVIMNLWEKTHLSLQRKILQRSLGYPFSTGELWFVNFFYSRLGG